MRNNSQQSLALRYCTGSTTPLKRTVIGKPAEEQEKVNKLEPPHTSVRATFKIKSSYAYQIMDPIAA
jgi:hypothetical protein